MTRTGSIGSCVGPAVTRMCLPASGRALSMLYFTNSLGAAIGVLVSGFVLIGWAGLPGTLRFAGDDVVDGGEGGTGASGEDERQQSGREHAPAPP